MNKTIGYIRVSTDKQDLESQKFAILDYAQKHNLKINEFVDVEASSRKDESIRKIDILKDKLLKDDTLIITELSRLGRNMLEVLNIINHLTEEIGAKIIFIRQPELSTTGKQAKFMMAIYGYFAETERDFISERTKAGLEAARAKGVILGRPTGSGNQSKKLDEHKDKIIDYLKKDITISAITKIINADLEKKISYSTFKNYIKELNVE